MSQGHYDGFKSGPSCFFRLFKRPDVLGDGRVCDVYRRVVSEIGFLQVSGLAGIVIVIFRLFDRFSEALELDRSVPTASQSTPFFLFRSNFLTNAFRPKSWTGIDRARFFPSDPGWNFFFSVAKPFCHRKSKTGPFFWIFFGDLVHKKKLYFIK